MRGQVKHVRVTEQASKQQLCMDALYVVANVGYDKEVRAVFSLIRHVDGLSAMERHHQPQDKAHKDRMPETTPGLSSS